MLKLYNTLTSKIEPFEPIKKNHISMYICGPTVYGDIHLGNARPVIFFDVAKRYFKYLGYDVKLVSNITDVDDKIIEKAKELKLNENQLTDLYTKNFIDMTLTLGSVIPDLMPKATEFVPQMIHYIEDLINLGFAYVLPSGVYFRVTKVEDYGVLSKQNMEELNQGVRITLEDEKENPRDFSIWKTSNEGLAFDSPWGKGRPGWHTECAVINHEVFGEEIDIHGGGTDLIFPHHENEIAQTVVHDHHHLARVWMHVGRLEVNQVKMSKSLGNISLVKDLITAFNPLSFRLLMIGHHYRQPINYTDDLMVQFSKEYDKIERALKKAFLMMSLDDISTQQPITQYLEQFEDHMNDDFNIPNVMTLIYELVKLLNKEQDIQMIGRLYQTIKTILDVLGVMPIFKVTESTLDLYRAWNQARSNKDYMRADQLRSELAEQGWM
ncbi:MAG: cysteine--tRNA ligase [Acholeplasmataceae bacterium]|nr:cysteine--tRNA ligase [Acholeplasmataceae bacterium]